MWEVGTSTFGEKDWVGHQKLDPTSFCCSRNCQHSESSRKGRLSTKKLHAAAPAQKEKTNRKAPAAADTRGDQPGPSGQLLPAEGDPQPASDKPLKKRVRASGDQELSKRILLQGMKTGIAVLVTSLC